jgi:hypothetical protein
MPRTDGPGFAQPSGRGPIPGLAAPMAPRKPFNFALDNAQDASSAGIRWRAPRSPQSPAAAGSGPGADPAGGNATGPALPRRPSNLGRMAGGELRPPARSPADSPSSARPIPKPRSTVPSPAPGSPPDPVYDTVTRAAPRKPSRKFIDEPIYAEIRKPRPAAASAASPANASAVRHGSQAPGSAAPASDRAWTRTPSRPLPPPPSRPAPLPPGRATAGAAQPSQAAAGAKSLGQGKDGDVPPPVPAHRRAQGA